ncbi:MAG: tetracycline resistance MFS efflux pump [Acidimicrobiia bacterium]|nr:MAG: tetracycline resistance MFS efflux pump [Acidimicrobiia bacterium]
MNLRSMDKRLVTILLIVFVQMVGAGLILPILPIFAQKEFGLSPTAIAFLVASFFAAQFIGGPILGRWSDRIGRVPVLVVSQIGTVVAFAAFGLAGSAWVLFAARIFDGLTGGNLVVAQAYITDVTPVEKRAQALGLISAMFGLGFMIGPALGGLLVEFGGLRIPYFFAAGAAGLVVALTLFTLDESHTEERRAEMHTNGEKLTIRRALAIRPLLLVLSIAFVAQFSLGLIIATFALFGQEVLFETNVELGVGILLAFIGLSQIITQVALLPRLLERFGEARLVTIGIIIRSVGFAIYAVMVDPWQAALGGVLFAAGGGLALPPTQSIATKVVDESVRGGVLGVFQSVQSLSIILGTALAGVLFTLEAHLPNIVAFGFSLVSLIPAIVVTRRLGTGVTSRM